MTGEASSGDVNKKSEGAGVLIPWGAVSSWGLSLAALTYIRPPRRG